MRIRRIAFALALVPALVAGDVSRMDPQVKADSQDAGLSHLTATRMTELAWAEQRVDAVTLRVFNPIGAGMRANVLGHAATRLREAVDRTRFRLAQHYLAQRHLPLSEIALLLGYSELSAFTRAFTRWAGTSPRSYRSARRQ